MTRFIHIVRGAIVFCMLAATTAVSAIFICLSWLMILPLPSKWRFYMQKQVNKLPFLWASIMNFFLKWFLPIRWNVNLPKELNRKQWYLLIANHQSWVDILILNKVFTSKTATLKFFLKKELLWRLPLAGLACYAVDFPFLVRHHKKHLLKNPKLKGKDIETTQKACEKFKTSPCTIINFAEGTRFTQAKHHRQQPNYRYLLKPKVAGIALVLQSLENHLSGILDVTIHYGDISPTFWKFISGQIKTIDVVAQLLPIPKTLIGDYYKDRDFRKKLQHHFNQIWAEKDQLLTRLNKQENITHE
jgi:1-acyl-sn-glycerol-3-phosphate acyltransferase